ncbi:carboxylate-amine ligase [Microbacterium sp. GXF7504]
MRTPRTMGVEEELLLVDRATFEPVPLIAEALAAAGADGAWLRHELKQEQIEVATPPVSHHTELATAIDEARRIADAAARAVGARAVPLATPPMVCRTHLVETSRFLAMQDPFGVVLDEQLTGGCHVHVAIASPDEGVGVLDRIRPWLPLILALSANSPFWGGHDTSFASYRQQLWWRWQTTGPTELFGTAEAYRAAVDALIAGGVTMDEGMVYFDARLSSHVPTVEVRIADVCLEAQDAVTIGLLVRALVTRAAADWRAGVAPSAMPSAILRAASWRASRWGVEGDLLHPDTGRIVPAADAVDVLLRHAASGFTDDAERARAHAGVARILARGSGAARQRAAHARGGVRGVIAEAIALGLGAHEAPLGTGPAAA